MPSTAVSAQGTTLQVSTGTGGAKTITAIALGFPTILTAAAHGFNNGDVAALAALTGADAALLNGLSLPVKNKTTNTWAVDIDTTGKTITVGAGTATPVTYTQVKNMKTVGGLDGSSAEIDVTNLDSVAKEFQVGLPDSGGLSVEFDEDDTDAGQTALRLAYQTRLLKSFKLTLSNGKVFSFSAYVKKLATNLAVDGIVKMSCDLRITGAYTLA
jgi:hypothetical protein